MPPLYSCSQPEGGNFTELPAGPDGKVGSDILDFGKRKWRIVEEVRGREDDGGREARRAQATS